MPGQVKGLASLRRKLGILTDEERRVAAIEVKRGLVNIESGAKQRVKVDQGELRNSITHLTTNGGLSGVAGTNKVHGPPTEFGRRPGVMPPVEPIRRWAKRKGIDEDAAFAIALKIAREGTPPAPFLFPSFEEERPKFLRRLQRALDAAHRKVSR